MHIIRKWAKAYTNRGRAHPILDLWRFSGPENNFLLWKSTHPKYEYVNPKYIYREAYAQNFRSIALKLTELWSLENVAKMTDFRAFFTKLAPVTKRLQLDPYYKGQTTSLGVYFDTMNKTENVKKILVKLFATGVISILLRFSNTFSICFGTLVQIN